MTALGKSPAHWQETTIGEIADVRLGRQRSPKNHAGDQMQPYLRAANVNWYRLRPDDIQTMNFTTEEMATYALQQDDILIVEGSGSATEVGKCALVPSASVGHAFQNTLIRVRPKTGVDPRWLMYRINADAELGGFLALARGSGIFHLGSTRTAKWPVALPPLAEQHAIVETIERMLSHLDVAEADQVRTRARFSTLRDAVVEAAMRGRPTEEPQADAGAELLRVNETLKRRQDKVGPQPPPTWLPPGWAWVTLQTAVGRDGLIADGDWVETKDQDPAGSIRLLQLSDVGRGVFRNRSNRFINETASLRLGVTDVQAGDVLVSRLGDPPGDATVVPVLGQRAITSVDVCIVRPAAGAVSAEWLMWCFNSPRFRASVVQHQSGTTRKRISRSKLEQLCVPVPPLQQQRLLIDWIMSQTARVGRLEAALEAGTERSKALRRSILKAAFEGRLTSTTAAPSAEDLQEDVA